MRRINFHFSEKTRQLVIAAVVAVAGIAMFSETYQFLYANKVNEQTMAPAVSGNTNSQTKKVVEAHWQGMEVVPLTWELAAKMGIPINEKGVLVDEVTLTAADSGLVAKDIVQSMNGLKITNLDEFYTATRRLRNQNMATIGIKRGNTTMSIELVVPDGLGFAQLESAPMVLAGSIAPHRYRGPCTDCHAIGNTGQLTPDPGLVTLAPPPISKNTNNPHRNRGKCKDCHVVR